MIIEALVDKAKSFLSEDMEININNTTIVDNSPDNLPLLDYTSMIGTGGTLNIMVVITFEKNFLATLAELFMDGEEIIDEEKEEVYDSVSGETINTIIGLAIPNFPDNGTGITITPPIGISDASTIKKYKNSKIITANIQTQFGNLSISAMGSVESIK